MTYSSHEPDYGQAKLHSISTCNVGLWSFVIIGDTIFDVQCFISNSLYCSTVVASCYYNLINAIVAEDYP